MPPEILAFRTALGRDPTSPQELQAFIQQLSQQNAGALGQLPGGPGAPLPGPVFMPEMGSPGGAPLPPARGPASPGVSRTFTPELQPPFPSAERRRGLDAAALGPSASLGTPAPSPIPGAAPGAPELAAPAAGVAGVPTQPTPASGGVAEGIARARLGGGTQGFSFPQAVSPTPAPVVNPVPAFGPSVSGGGLDLGQFGQILPGIEDTGTGEVVLNLRAQEEQKNQARAQLAIGALGSLLGGGLLGGIGSGQARAI